MVLPVFPVGGLGIMSSALWGCGLASMRIYCVWGFLIGAFGVPCLKGCYRFLYNLEFSRLSDVCNPAVLNRTMSHVVSSLMFTKETTG